MRAVRLEAFGQPLAVYEDWPVPEPRAGEVRVRVLAAGVCGTDVKLWKGDIPDTPLPLTLGHETAGVVEDGAGELASGTRVVALHHLFCGECANCLAGCENLCLRLRGRIGFDHDGGWADYFVAPARNLLPVPDGVSTPVAAVVPDAVATAWRAVVRIGRIAAGETVVVIGLGGLGLAACQIALERGAEVVAVDVTPDKLAHAAGLGVRTTALAGDVDAHADVVIDCAGASGAVKLAARLLGPGGRLVQVGYARSAALSLPTARVALEELEIRGCRAASLADLEDALSAVARGAVTPLIGVVRPLDEAQAALDDLAAGRVAGRQVLAASDGL